MKEEKSLMSTILGKVFPVAQNAQGLTDPRRSGRPEIDRFAGVLSVLAYDSLKGVFLLNAGGETPPCALGRVLEINPVLWADESLASVFERLLRIEYPASTTLAFSLYASPCIEKTLDTYVDARNRCLGKVSSKAHELLVTMSRERKALFEAMARGKNARGFPARHFRVWMSLVSTIGSDALNPESGAFSAFVTAADAAEASLAATSLLSHAWKGADYVASVRELINPQRTRATLRENAAYDADRPLRDVVISNETALDIERDDMVFTDTGDRGLEPVFAQALGVASYPSMTTINAMHALLGGDKRTLSPIEDPYIVTCAVEPTSRTDDRTTTAVKLARVKQLTQTEIGMFLTDLKERARDLEIASNACRDGAGLARITHEVVVFSHEASAARAREAAKALLAEAGLEAEVDSGLQMMGLLLSLPMEASTALMQDAKAARHTSTKTREAASQMLPLLAEARGGTVRPGESVPVPMTLLTTRAGELVTLDLFANRNGNNNAVVAANSGAGKSVFIEDVVLAMLATGGRVWVFDIGKSYRHCEDLVAGQWIDFESDTSLCINPLDGFTDEEPPIDEIADIVVALANGNAPLEMTALEKLKGLLEALLRRAKDERRLITITDLVADLMVSDDSILRDLSIRLRPYGAGGRYARWFEGKNTVNFLSPLVVLEMQALASKPVLQNAVLLILILTIVSQIRKLPRSEKKLIVIDEAWRLLTGNAGAFIEWACRTLRKYGAGIVCISQSLEDFEAGSAARAVRANADNVFLLRQKKSSIDLFTDDPYTREVIASLTTEAGVMSEMYMKLGDRPGVVVRLFLDPFSMTAYSTRSDVFEAVEKEKASGKSVVEAIRTVLAKRQGEGL